MALQVSPIEDERPPESHSRRGSRLAPSVIAAVLVVVWLIMMTVTGSPAGDVLRWAGAVLVGVLAPGFVLVRVSRRATAPLLEDLSWASAAGSLVALLGWFLDRILPFSPAPYLVGPAVIVIALAIPQARRRVLARPAPGWGTGASLALGGVMLVAFAWMLATGLVAYQPDPGVHGTGYYPDIMYQLDLVGEVRHALVPTYPAVAGTPLSYHWFLYAITAHLLQHSGIDPFDSTLRLGPATLIPAILMLAAVVARRLSGRVWAGPCAAALLGVLDISEASKWTTEDGTTGVLPRIWRASPPQTMGWLASLAAAGALFAFVRRAPEDRAVPVALLIPFMILTAGSKSSELPVLMAGVALATAVQVIRRDWALLRRCLLTLALGLAVFEAATLTIYGSSSYGIKRQLWGAALARMSSMFPAYETKRSALTLTSPHTAALALATVVLLFFLPLLPRLLGLFFQLRYRPEDPTGWICFGTAVAGLGVPFLVRHPAGSEIYFMLSAYPIGVVGAASGLALAGARARRAMRSPVAARRFGLWLGILVLAGASSAAIVANVQPRFDPLQRWARTHPGDPKAAGVSLRRMAWLWLTPTVTLLAVLVVLVLVAAVVVRRVWPGPGTRRWGRRGGSAEVSATPGPGRAAGLRAPLVWLCVMSLLLGTGLFTMTLHFGGTDTAAPGSSAAVHPPLKQLNSGRILPTMRDTVAAGRWVDAHAKADDVVATNMYCRYSRNARAHGAPCDARNFVASALTQRRTLVGGWAYADRIVANAWTLKTAYRNAPFWDPALLAEQRVAFTHPSKAALESLYRAHHVRWIFLDLRDGTVDIAGLDQLATQRYLGPSTGVWQVRAPQSAR